MTARWDPLADLDRLLAALEAEILASSDEEVRTALVDLGRPREVALREIAAALAARVIEDEVGSAALAARADGAARPLWRH